jgi:hypothetical protein
MTEIEDWTAFVGEPSGVPGGITVDVGSLAVTPTHTTRDGYPMEVRYKPHLGWLVAVDTDPT